MPLTEDCQGPFEGPSGPNKLFPQFCYPTEPCPTAKTQLFPVLQNWLRVWTWAFSVLPEEEDSALLSDSWSFLGCAFAPPPRHGVIGARFEPGSTLQHPISLSALSFLRVRGRQPCLIFRVDCRLHLEIKVDLCSDFGQGNVF